MKTRLPLIALTLTATTLACGESFASPPAAPPSEPDIHALAIPSGFDFRSDVDVPVSLFFPAGHPARTTDRFRLFVEQDGELDLLVDGRLLSDGSFESVVRVPTAASGIVLEWEVGDSRVARTYLAIHPLGVRFGGDPSNLQVAEGEIAPLSARMPRPGTGSAEATTPPIARVPIELDNYPIASVSYYPSRSTWGTIAFEDNWPRKGDYDFNDLVLSYHVVQYRNPGGRIVAMEFFLRPEAAGASFANGFGFSLPIDRKRVHFASGSLSRRQDEDGLEPGHPNAVVIAFDNVSALLPGAGIRNTRPGQGSVRGAEQRIVLHFRTPLKDRDLGTPPFDPFLIVDGERGREVHLIGGSPTSLASASTSSGDDAGGYRTAQGLPWGIVLPAGWTWPAEKEPVHLGHLEFGDWAVSGGRTYTDWYRDKGDNRNPARLFRR